MDPNAPQHLAFDVTILPEDVDAAIAFAKRVAMSEARSMSWRSDSFLIAMADVAFLLGAFFVVRSDPRAAVIVGTVLMTVGFLGIQVAVNVIAKRQVRRSLDELNAHFQLNESGLTVQRPGRTSYTSTRELVGLEVTPTHLFLRQTSQTFWIVPRRCIGGPDEQALAVSLLSGVAPLS